MGYAFTAAYMAVIAAAIIINWWLLVVLVPVFVTHAGLRKKVHVRARRARGLEE